MAFTAEEQEQYFKDCFGCDPNEALKSARCSFTYEISGITGIVTSMLSDVQEMLVRNMNEDARKYLNLSKFFLNKDTVK